MWLLSKNGLPQVHVLWKHFHVAVGAHQCIWLLYVSPLFLVLMPGLYIEIQKTWDHWKFVSQYIQQNVLKNLGPPFCSWWWWGIWWFWITLQFCTCLLFFVQLLLLMFFLQWWCCLEDLCFLIGPFPYCEELLFQRFKIIISLTDTIWLITAKFLFALRESLMWYTLKLTTFIRLLWMIFLVSILPFYNEYPIYHNSFWLYSSQ
jgi:hypothetical protein